jgi:hypothetical protein
VRWRDCTCELSDAHRTVCTLQNGARLLDQSRPIKRVEGVPEIVARFAEIRPLQREIQIGEVIVKRRLEQEAFGQRNPRERKADRGQGTVGSSGVAVPIDLQRHGKELIKQGADAMMLEREVGAQVATHITLDTRARLQDSL